MKTNRKRQDTRPAGRANPATSGCENCAARTGRWAMTRRSFLATAAAAGMAAALAKTPMLAFASPSRAEIPKPAGGPRVRVVFVRPPEEPIVSWPGGNCDVPAQQALFTRTLREAAEKIGVQLDVRDEPLHKPEDVSAFLDRIKQSPPDGLIVAAMSLGLWAPVNEIVEKRGDVPTIIYSHASGFTDHLQCGRNTPKTFLAATTDVPWLATALRMFYTNWRLRNTRILMLTEAGRDVTLQPWGTQLRFIDKKRFEEVFKQVEESAEVRGIAKSYARNAKRIVEPSKKDILNAAKNYVACSRLMEAEKCHGISIACLGWVNPVCMSFSKLLDEGIPAVCEADQNAVIGELLAIHLLNRPGFIQDPSPNTVNNTFIVSHCTSPTRLEGLDKDKREDYWLRSYHTRTGCSMEVMWPIGKEVTILQANAGAPSMFVGTGRVRSNISQPPTGCCRTAVELEMDRVSDTRDVKGFHQLILLGNHAGTLQAYGRLFDIKVEPIA